MERLDDDAVCWGCEAPLDPDHTYDGHWCPACSADNGLDLTGLEGDDE